MTSTITRRAPLIYKAVGKHTATVIFAHGLGDTGQGWAQAVEHWRNSSDLDEIKFVLPHAPMMPITINGGMQCPAWFDIKNLGPAVRDLDTSSYNEDETRILESRSYLESLIDEEVKSGIPSERVVLGGFSQGAAMSLFTGVTTSRKLGGILALSSWLPLSKSLNRLINGGEPNKETPIFMGHGDRDMVVGYHLGRLSEKFLVERGYKVTFKTYGGMEHSACLEEFDEAQQYLVSRIPAQA